MTLNGSVVYVPCKQSDRQLVLDAATGARLAEFPMKKDPHNTFIGEQGRYVYCSARSGGPLYRANPKTHQVVKTIGPFSGPIRPFSVNESKTYFFANITKLSGFGKPCAKSPRKRPPRGARIPKRRPRCRMAISRSATGSRCGPARRRCGSSTMRGAIDFQDGVPVRVSGQNGGVYPPADGKN